MNKKMSLWNTSGSKVLYSDVYNEGHGQGVSKM